MILIIFLALCLPALYLYLTWNNNYWKKRLVPSEEPVILFGNLFESIIGRRSWGEIYDTMYFHHPQKKVVGWFKFREPALLIRDPELVKGILLTNFHSFRNNDIVVDEKVDPIMGKNIFVLRDELWKKARSLVTPAFTAGKIKAIYPVMQEVAKDLVEYLKQHPEELHTKHTMSRYTAEITARCSLGIEGNCFKDPEPAIHEMGKLIFQPDLVRNFIMMAVFLSPGIVKLFRLKVVPQKVLDFFDSILRDVIVYRQEKNIERNDFLQYMLDIKKKSIEVIQGQRESELITRAYSDDDVLSGCIMTFIETYETSAVVLNNILYFLALHKDVQNILKKEIDEVLNEGELTFEKLHSMNYLHSVYLESNRRMPVMYALQKVCTEKFEMDIGEGKPLVIEKGTPITLPINAIQNDPKHWEDPQSFKPERFFNKEAEADAKSKGIYLPFGEGPRMCPGSRIATTVIKVAVVHICANFEILKTSRTPDKIQQDPHYFMVAHKGGIFLKFAERTR